MIEYPKIETPYERSMDGRRQLIYGLFQSPEVEFLAEDEWQWTEKVDGTNIRIHWDGHDVEFGGRAEKSQIPAPMFNRLNELFGGETNAQMFEQVFGEKDVILFGEGYGNKIKAVGSQYLPDSVDFALFDVLIGDIWLKWNVVEDVAKMFGVQTVPVVGYGTLYEAIDFVRERHETHLPNSTAPMEGLVIRNPLGMLTRDGKRIVVKVKYRDFKDYANE